MNKIEIVLFGLTLQSSNKGCEALAYSFLSILNDTLKRLNVYANVRSVVYQPKGTILNRDVSMFERIEHTFLPNRKKSAKCQMDILQAIRHSDLCIDFTDGDSFSDIYGNSRFFWRTLEKSTAIALGKRMLLGPQTYGPYTAKYAERWAAWVITKADYVYSRDLKSAELVHEISGRYIKSTTDIAMALPAITKERLSGEKMKVGINISGLLWNNGYTGKNEFGLKVYYREYVERLIVECMGMRNTQVYLVPHVINENMPNSNENDLIVCQQLQKTYPALKIIDRCETPMHIKGYIAQMDVFTGARMHSTIAAFSTGVATIPFAYSKKFGDLYHAIDYPYIVDGREMSTDDALSMSIKYIENYKVLRDSVSKSEKIMKKQLQVFCDDMLSIIGEVAK